ncbi:DNA-binding barrel domain superfamily [Sesbania bispinosa]|nr:DNA-binding barrel domain superfamily [Sesbania bispinosa]
MCLVSYHNQDRDQTQCLRGFITWCVSLYHNRIWFFQQEKETRQQSTHWFKKEELMLSDDPWKIKKILKESDLGKLSTFLLGRDLAKELVMHVLGVDADLDNGTQVMIWDVDTNSMHTLLFKRWVSSRSYVFIGS